MNSLYLSRTLEPVLQQVAKEFPAVVLTGPRQSGKTTLLKHVFGSNSRYASLDTPDVRARAIHDPRGFLESLPPPVILDEVQYAPDLLFYIKELIDSKREQRGQYLLTGSQDLLLSETVTESLAGRTAVLRLLPLSNREAKARPQTPLVWEQGTEPKPKESPSTLQMWEVFIRGGYPELVCDRDRNVARWHANYVRTFLERDVRSIRQVGDLTQFQDFLRLLAARSAQLLNITSIARDLGVAVNTIKAWLSVLEANYQVTVLRPHFANVKKHLVKTPKVYFSDVGTLCHLVGLSDPLHASAGPMSGAIMETAVLSELRRSLIHRGLDPHIYFWRTSAGTEVDFIVRTNKGLVPIEVKTTGTPRPAMASSIVQFQRDLGPEATNGYVVHSGNTTLALNSSVKALPFYSL
ncbi:MAG: ATP-binding protein [Gammaproteobacteria bacterium]|nr:ATP-binding protein [Gammaproteobacteria bacterium]MYD80061.1 ATP-binding protein [Gammaproteobacteria bacterium]